MKKYFLAIFTSIALINGTFAQNNKQLITEVDKTVQEIKKNNPSFQKIEKLKDSTGYKYLYTKDKDLQLVRIFFKDNNLDKKVEWYFSKGQLIYSEQIWTDNTNGKVFDNQKFYLSKEQLVAWLKSGDKTVEPASQEFKTASAELQAYANKLKAEINKN